EFFSAHGFSHRDTRRGPAGDELVVVADVAALR
ncbi:GNAT family N-acetyltransferase, partial [Halorubrum sp. E3]